ncbi:hypothetical protein CYL18_02660 [Pradoshia eiseniae]|uniref:Transporter n=1 Tax=Pradoshia eiseniae TaxID=2064768 RepID=A0A2S7N5E7_9BACI|nr:hypothetical protein [Pradoshia eiseniae]PQD97246.1 hypothetical protein CYL18_02660 [Pradoshia eiseniae]
MKNSIKIASAFIGIIIGAGFASGQEILQYFTSFGMMGTVGAAISIVLFGFLGMVLTKIGSRLDTDSHKEVIYKISGRYLGILIDSILVFILFGIGVVMISGSGSIFAQQFGMPQYVGIILMTVLVLIAILSNVDQVVKIIASITPFLIIGVVVLFVYSLATKDYSFMELDALAKEQPSATAHWFTSVINYVSLAITMGASMTLVMGGDESKERIASYGGMLGGIGVGILIVIHHLAILAKIDVVGDYDMPSLGLANHISPIFGVIYSVILFGMIFNSAVSMFFSFGTRFFTPKTKKFNWFVGGTLLIAFGASFFGFKQLVSIFYPLFGYLGMILIAILIIAFIRMRPLKEIEKE